jgi:hypothetical protein
MIAVKNQKYEMHAEIIFLRPVQAFPRNLTGRLRKDKRQKTNKQKVGVTWMETHNSLIYLFSIPLLLFEFLYKI